MQKLLVGMALSWLAWAAVAAPKGGDDGWARVSVESVGLDPAALDVLDGDFRKGTIPLVDSLLVLRCGTVAYERHYAHDYASVYAKEAREVGPLNPYLKGPYNYFDPAWHPYWHGGDAHTMQSITKSVTSATIGAAMTSRRRSTRRCCTGSTRPGSSMSMRASAA